MTRRYVFPALRLVLLAAIAAALIRLAFSPDEDEPTGQPMEPSAEITQPEVAVGLGTVVNTVTVEATITADPATPVKATDAGTVNVLLAEPGDVVEKGDPVLEVVYEEEAVEAPPEEGEDAEAPAAPRRRYRTVEAPVSGRLGEFSVLRGQDVAIGDTVATITAGGFSVAGTLTPEQQYRLVGAPTAAEITAEGGPAPFACTDLSIGRPVAAPEGNEQPADPPDDGSSGGGSTTQVRCTVPPEVTVFDGLTASMAIEAGRSENVLVVPVTAVEGSFASGNVWVVGPDGAPVETAVTLGLTDGEQIEVTGGLAEGDSVLEFVPVPDDDADTGDMSGMEGVVPLEGGEVVEGAAGT